MIPLEIAILAKNWLDSQEKDIAISHQRQVIGSWLTPRFNENYQITIAFSDIEHLRLPDHPLK